MSTVNRAIFQRGRELWNPSMNDEVRCTKMMCAVGDEINVLPVFDGYDIYHINTHDDHAWISTFGKDGESIIKFLNPTRAVDSREQYWTIVSQMYKYVKVGEVNTHGLPEPRFHDNYRILFEGQEFLFNYENYYYTAGDYWGCQPVLKMVSEEYICRVYSIHENEEYTTFDGVYILVSDNSSSSLLATYTDPYYDVENAMCLLNYPLSFSDDLIDSIHHGIDSHEYHPFQFRILQAREEHYLGAKLTIKIKWNNNHTSGRFEVTEIDLPKTIILSLENYDEVGGGYNCSGHLLMATYDQLYQNYSFPETSDPLFRLDDPLDDFFKNYLTYNPHIGLPIYLTKENI